MPGAAITARQFVTSTMSGRDMTTWRRLQRRLIVRRIGYPGRVAHGTGHIAIVVDTSGSIDQKMLNLFGGHMAAIMDDARPELVSLLWVDAATWVLLAAVGAVLLRSADLVPGSA